MGFTPKMRPDVALQRGIGTCDNGWDWGTLYLLQDAGVESGTGGFGGPLVGAQSILSNVKLWEKEEGVGLSTAGSQENLTWLLHGGGGQVGVLMLELAIKSQASLLTVGCKCGSDGVRFGEGGIGCHSLTGRGWTGEFRASISQVSAQCLPEDTQHPARHLGRARPATLPSPCSCLGWFPALLPSHNHFFFCPPAFSAAGLVLRGTDAVAGPRDANQGEEADRGQLLTCPQGPPQPALACAGGMVSTTSPLLCFLCICSSHPGTSVA